MNNIEIKKNYISQVIDSVHDMMLSVQVDIQYSNHSEINFSAYQPPAFISLLLSPDTWILYILLISSSTIDCKELMKQTEKNPIWLLIRKTDLKSSEKEGIKERQRFLFSDCFKINFLIYSIIFIKQIAT